MQNTEQIFTEIAKYSQHLEQKFAIGCSGGVDSISLCFALRQSGFTNFVAIICNHNIRPNAYNEARQVCAYLQANGFEVALLDLKNFEKTKNLENNARIARQKAMFAYCLSGGIKTLLLAHNKNDAIETFFMRLERGTGLAGLCSIEPQTSFCVMQDGAVCVLNIIRPFINIQKEQIINFANANNLQIWQDETNFDTKIRRNFVRNILHQQKCQSQIMQNISTTISNLQSENKFIENLANQHFKACVSFKNKTEDDFCENTLVPKTPCSKINLNIEKYANLPYNIRRFILVQIISVLQFFNEVRQSNDITIFNKTNIRQSKIDNLDNFLCVQNNKPFYAISNIKVKFVENFVCVFSVN